ncbi:MAG: peptidase C1 [Flavobacteriales bacterium]|nr:MAG: peptidase C1 [Flavobacteriales bacterium]
MAVFSFAQNKDKAEFVDYNNEFYGEIKKSLDGPAAESKPHKVFRMDQSNIDAPKSINEFTTVWCQPPVSQGRAGTCWCFSTSSFYEAEIFRITKQKVKLSELYTVYWEYVEKAREYVRTRGGSFFGEGSETNAVARMMKQYGIVPANAYAGKKEELEYHDHKGMFSEMNSYLESIKKQNAWNEEIVISTIKSILNHHIGEPPSQITVNGKSMTPLEYMQNVAKINPSDYVNFMSLMKSPYNSKAVYDVPDNWWKSDDYYNVPLNDFLKAIKSALKDGYSISIGGDVSESGLNPMSDIAVVPTYDIPSEYIDESARQLRFSNGSTTDDHAIHLIGYTKKDNGHWFLIKDSGSSARNGNNKGYYFYHEDYIKLKMMTFTVHRDAVKQFIAKMD